VAENRLMLNSKKSVGLESQMHTPSSKPETPVADISFMKSSLETGGFGGSTWLLASSRFTSNAAYVGHIVY
jgi:hypothetical protein